MVRIVQASLVFSVSTAKSFVTWLNDHIEQAEKFKGELSKTSDKGGTRMESLYPVSGESTTFPGWIVPPKAKRSVGPGGP